MVALFLKLCTDALKSGWTKFKVKVGADLEDDVRRCRLIREMIGPNNKLVWLTLALLLYLQLEMTLKCLFVLDDRCQPEMGCS